MNLRRAATTTAALSLVLAGAACANDDPDMPMMDDMSGMDGMDGMDGMAMGDPGATPADEVDGDVTSGEFSVLDTAPPGSDGAAGQAWLAQNDDGTTVTIRLTGLAPDTAYMAHLHAEACASDNGGPHFMFDLDGSEMPPNEVHLAFTADDDGAGEVTVTNEQRVGDGAPSVVIHPTDAMDNRLACADFS
ncbi:CHRD domain-containing protein [Nocardioides sp.]|uniref:CHRD domain-containing protein n=1 Tax=Nocardioides sp. TaxID=35761 RepID=UPI002B26A823|nr:CHRD domain-containing protein [Nocardioides sp.]